MNLVSESIEDFQFDLLVEESGQQLADAIEEGIREKKELKEGAAALTLGALLALPAFVKVLGIVIKKIGKLFRGKLGDETKGEKAGKALEKFAHKMEHKIQQPLTWIITKLGVKKDKAAKWSKAIHALVVILLGMYSGIETVHAIKAANVSKATAEGFLTALKAGETGETLLNAIKGAA